MIKEEGKDLLIKETNKFEFIQCEYMKDDNTRCKKQAPKGKTICSAHQKLLAKG